MTKSASTSPSSIPTAPATSDRRDGEERPGAEAHPRARATPGGGRAARRDRRAMSRANAPHPSALPAGRRPSPTVEPGSSQPDQQSTTAASFRRRCLRASARLARQTETPSIDGERDRRRRPGRARRSRARDRTASGLDGQPAHAKQVARCRPGSTLFTPTPPTTIPSEPAEAEGGRPGDHPPARGLDGVHHTEGLRPPERTVRATRPASHRRPSVGSVPLKASHPKQEADGQPDRESDQDATALPARRGCLDRLHHRGVPASHGLSSLRTGDDVVEGLRHRGAE